MEEAAKGIRQLACDLQTFNRWVKAGIIDKLFRELHFQKIAEKGLHTRLLDSMTVPVHPDACGALKKTENKQLDVPEGD